MSGASGLSLPGEYPVAGHVVVAALRDQTFTGEVIVQSSPETRIYLDRGRIYLAERSTDAPLGERLVAAGALDADQLERGVIRVAGTEYLGRLFAREIGVDRDAVLVATNASNDACLAWLAEQPTVASATATAYQRHPSSVHRWDQPSDEEIAEVVASAPLPPPLATATPVSLAPPDALLRVVEAAGAAAREASAGIRWDEPSWLDERPAGTHCRISTVPETPAEPMGAGCLDADGQFDLRISPSWFDNLGIDSSEPVAARDQASVAPVAPVASWATPAAPESPPATWVAPVDPALMAAPSVDGHTPVDAGAGVSDMVMSDMVNGHHDAAKDGAGPGDDVVVDETDRTAALRRLVGGLRRT